MVKHYSVFGLESIPEIDGGSNLAEIIIFSSCPRKELNRTNHFKSKY
jgi:hypothetical protein